MDEDGRRKTEGGKGKGKGRGRPRRIFLTYHLSPGLRAYFRIRAAVLVRSTLFRTTSMGAAARWMQEHGMPPLARGVRNTGEQATLIPPAESCGA